MAIRLREIDGVWIAICAARSMPKQGDVYLHDGMHHALSVKFDQDFGNEYRITPWSDAEKDRLALMEQEESNNPNREWWDKEYGQDTGK